LKSVSFQNLHAFQASNGRASALQTIFQSRTREAGGSKALKSWRFSKFASDAVNPLVSIFSFFILQSNYSILKYLL